MHIPTIDVARLSTDQAELERVAAELGRAFSTTGFAAVINHNMRRDTV